MLSLLAFLIENAKLAICLSIKKTPKLDAASAHIRPFQITKVLIFENVFSLFY